MKARRDYTAIIEAAAHGALARALYRDDDDTGLLFTLAAQPDLFSLCCGSLVAPAYFERDRKGLLSHCFNSPLDDETLNSDTEAMRSLNPLQTLTLHYLEVCCDGIEELAAEIEKKTGFTHHVLTVGANTCGDWNAVESYRLEGFDIWIDEDGHHRAEVCGEIWLHVAGAEYA